MCVRSRSRWVQLAVMVTLGVGVAGCSGEGILNVIQPGQPTTGVAISGQVQAPNGELVQGPALWDRMLAFTLPSARAITANNVEGVLQGVQVRLILVAPEDVVDGGIPTGLPVVSSVLTNQFGQYQILLPLDTSFDVCRFMVEVGNFNDGTLTRAFIFREGNLDINLQSETVVRLILNALDTGVAGSLCDYDPIDLGILYGAVVDLPGVVPGDSVEVVNAEAYAVASADPGIQDLLQELAAP